MAPPPTLFTTPFLKPHTPPIHHLKATPHQPHDIHPPHTTPAHHLEGSPNQPHVPSPIDPPITNTGTSTIGLASGASTIQPAICDQSIGSSPTNAQPKARDPPMNTHSMVTRAKSGIFKPKALMTTKHPLPQASEPTCIFLTNRDAN